MSRYLDSMRKEISQPIDVGIHALELYFPKNYVDQSKLEEFDKVSPGKYTIGLGQLQMGFFCDHEDINSICLTVLNNLLEKNQIDKSSIGYLAVGTETLVDKSKSVKTVLMNLFEENHDIEGVDIKNACYGGTQAIYSAIDWVYSNWESEKRYALAVMGDVAIYAPGPARCTGGAGAFAVLIGPGAPFVFERGLRGSYMNDLYDFYKPIGGMTTDFPIVDGSLSLNSYLIAAEECYKAYCIKSKRLYNRDVSLNSFDSIMFHSPFTKLVQKTVGKLSYLDFLSNKGDYLLEGGNFNEYQSSGSDELNNNKNFINTCVKISSKIWEKKTKPNTIFNARIGNMYTSSLYSQLVARISRLSGNSEDKNIQPFLLFSYGSGCASTMFSIRLNITNSNKESFDHVLNASIDAIKRLEERVETSPEYYTEKLLEREALTLGGIPYTPTSLGNEEKDNLFPGTYYLKHVDSLYKREYDRY
uniref:Hydroxymethylglutaryl-CoA synthase n=1 Tax=Parastrongyloides trichosuri TaxID=131310 RepID=A0A0N4Z3N6_PARTI